MSISLANILLLSDGDEDQEERHLGTSSTTASKTKHNNKVKNKHNAKNQAGETPLQVAAIDGDADKVAKLLELGTPSDHDWCL